VANQYKKTTNLPKTEFPMRASLAQNEPKRLAAWVYELMLKKNEGHEKFVLHDGPPYANGPIHLGHAQNKISKDIINRYWAMQGYQTPYVPGWDCHGQPIEHKVEEMLGTEKFNQLPTEKVRELCRKMAVEQVDTQRQGFRRLGVLAEWDNPYLTYVNDYDATDIEIFKAIFDSGAIYRGRKPVHWCSHCHTALAEAEIEYGDEVSPAIFVRFEMTTVPAGLEAWKDSLWVDIWTTTPWTLPADDAVILHPEAEYVAVLVDGRAEIMAEALVERCCAKFGYESYELAKGADGSTWHMNGVELCHNKYLQPIFGDQGVEGEFIYADYVTLDDGTGVVHTAPGHGVDDYNAGMRFGIPVVMPVDDDGRFYKGEGLGTGGPWSGMEVNEANPKIIKWLGERGTLILHEDITHSYPHCWRCKQPVIFRATSQWFVSMDKTGLRKKALEELSKVAFYPSHAIKRIGSMVEGRPDWCISRQRNWGVPIPAFTCQDCGETVMNDATLDKVITLFREKGSDAWFTDDPASYLGDACTCPACGSHDLKANPDILDVWWDSGVSHTAVCRHRGYLKFPADMYLEGSDQHRGWFMSSLMTSVGAYGVAPYKSVVSQGFTLDGQGRKMSKSLGNVIDPNGECDTRGADVLRLWVASVDTSTDVPCDSMILDHVGEAYRKIRNTFRFLLGEIEGQFDPATDAVATADLLPYDRLVLAHLCERGLPRLPLQRGLPSALRLRDRALQRLPQRYEGPRLLRRRHELRAQERPDHVGADPLHARSRLPADPGLHDRRGHAVPARLHARRPGLRGPSRLVPGTHDRRRVPRAPARVRGAGRGPRGLHEGLRGRPGIRHRHREDLAGRSRRAHGSRGRLRAPRGRRRLRPRRALRVLRGVRRARRGLRLHRAARTRREVPEVLELA